MPVHVQMYIINCLPLDPLLMTWIVATICKPVPLILVKHSTLVPFKSTVTLLTDKVDISGSVALVECLEIVSEVSELILIGLIIRV